MTPGQAAYEAYRFHQDGKAFNGKPIPLWDAVRPDIKRAWEAAANAVLKHPMAVHAVKTVAESMDERPPAPKPLDAGAEF